MAEIVNLNKARKARDRAAKRAGADANAVKFGRSRAEKDLDQARAEKSARDHAAHKRDDDTEDDGA